MATWPLGEFRPSNQPIGRAPDVAAVLRMLHQPETRVVNLVGASGIGKTRILNAVAERLEFASHASRVVYPGSGDDVPMPWDAIVEQLSSSWHVPATVVVVDNAEGSDAAEQVDRLLRMRPRVKLLLARVTALRHSDARPFRVRSLPLPAVDLPLALAAEQPSLALLAQRARVASDGFRLTSSNLGSLIKICRAIGGHPLGLELAADRLPGLPPALMARQLVGAAGLGGWCRTAVCG